MPDRDPTPPARRVVTGWVPQLTTEFDDPSPSMRARLARGSTAPATTPIDDADATRPRVRMVALFEHDAAVPIRLDEPPAEPAPQLDAAEPHLVPAPLALVLAVVALIALLGYLLLTA